VPGNDEVWAPPGTSWPGKGAGPYSGGIGLGLHYRRALAAAGCSDTQYIQAWRAWNPEAAADLSTQEARAAAAEPASYGPAPRRREVVIHFANDLNNSVGVIRRSDDDSPIDILVRAACVQMGLPPLAPYVGWGRARKYILGGLVTQRRPDRHPPPPPEELIAQLRAGANWQVMPSATPLGVVVDGYGGVVWVAADFQNVKGTGVLLIGALEEEDAAPPPDEEEPGLYSAASKTRMREFQESHDSVTAASSGAPRREQQQQQPQQVGAAAAAFSPLVRLRNAVREAHILEGNGKTGTGAEGFAQLAGKEGAKLFSVATVLESRSAGTQTLLALAVPQALAKHLWLGDKADPAGYEVRTSKKAGKRAPRSFGSLGRTR
jgi:hypothetical protein